MKHKYRICYVETAEQIGGGQVGLFDILANLDYQVFEPWVITTSSQGQLYKCLKSFEKVHLAVVPFTAYLPKKLLTNQYLGIYSPIGVNLLKKKLLELKPALVHSNHLPAGKYGTKAAFMCKIPNIVTMRCMYYRRVFYYNRFVEKRICKYSDKIVFNSLRGADLFRERTNAHKKVTSILNGINLNAFSTIEPELIYQKFGIAEESKVFLLPARVYPDKGHHLLIKAIAKITAKYPQIHVVFLGDEDHCFKGYKEECKLLAKSLCVDSKITWINFHKEVVDFFKSSYCVVLPSYTEGCPRVLLEALAAGTPILGSKIDGINEIIEEGVNGFGFAPDDSDSLSLAIEKIMNMDQKSYQNMKANCLRIARQRYDIKDMIDKYQKLYLDLIRQK